MKKLLCLLLSLLVVFSLCSCLPFIDTEEIKKRISSLESFDEDNVDESLYDVLLEGVSKEELTNSFLNYVLEVASGKQTKNEENGFEEISIFKDGVTL